MKKKDVNMITVKYIILDKNISEEDIHKIVDDAFGDAEVGYWVCKESKEETVSEETAGKLVEARRGSD